MNLWRVVLDALTGHKEHWNPEDDETVRFLRQQKSEAEKETRRLRRERERRASWESLFEPSRGSDYD